MRVLLLLPTQGYRAPDFVEAARRLGLELTVASEEPNVLGSKVPGGYLTLDFADPERAARTAVEFSKGFPVDAVAGMDDLTAVAAARVAEALGLRGNPPEAAEAARDKALSRKLLRDAGLRVPWFEVRDASDPPDPGSLDYPLVVKPTTLSAGQGVVRVDGPERFERTWRRVASINEANGGSPRLLAEGYLPGAEVAVEGLLEPGGWRTLAVFDKPDPLVGPTFEETIYVRPSRLPMAVLRRLEAEAARAAAALGLRTGPVHAEFRVNDEGIWPLEVAARPIGGRCSRALRFDMGLSLEEVVLRNALGLETSTLQADPRPSGVLMVPIPSSGRLRAVAGVEEARRVPGVTEVLIAVHPGQTLVPLPEGSSYAGFVFARGASPAAVEASLREAWSAIRLELEPSAEPAASTRCR